MGRKLVLVMSLSIVLVGILTLAFNIQQVKASNAVSPYIAVVPASTVNPALTPGMNYTISVYTDYNGSDVWGFEFKLTYNPKVLEGIQVVNGDLIIEDVGTTMWFPGAFNNTSGELGLTGNGFFVMPGELVPVTSGPGIMANITFSVVGCGDSYITFGDETRLIGYNVTTQEHYNIIDKDLPDQIHHGCFSNVPVPIHDIYVRADGSVDPDTAPISSADNITYTLTNNIFIQSIIVERDNIVVDGTGYTVQGTGTWGSIGINLTERNNVTVKNIKEIKAFGCGILLNMSSNIAISGNNITANNDHGIKLWSSSNNRIHENNITNNSYGIYLEGSSNNNICGNNITANSHRGIFLAYSSDYNTISGYNIKDNNLGTVFIYSSNNFLYHNNFINNTNQVAVWAGDVNTWDNGYPSGGNYWSDYEERYPNATEIDDSDIWDTPYKINENNQDNYPLVPEFPSFLVLPLFMIATLLAVIVYRRKQS